MTRLRSNRARLSCPERGADSRDAMEWRELCAVEIGERVTYPARPRRATLRRWLTDPDFRERYAAALESYKMSVVEAAIEQADRDVEHARGRRRVAAMRRQVVARTQWLKLIEARAEAANDNVPDGQVASRPSGKEQRGISDEGVAILEDAADRLASAAPSNDAHADDSASWSAKDDARLTRSASSSPKDDARRSNYPSWSARTPRHSRASGSPGSQTEEAKTETLDSRLRGNDETKNDAPSTHHARAPAPPHSPSWSAKGDVPLTHSALSSPKGDARRSNYPSWSARTPRHSRASGSPGSQTEEAKTETLDSRLRGNDETELQAPSNDTDDGLQYAVEDLRYRAARREKDSVAEASPRAPEPAPPAADSESAPPAADAPIESLLPPIELDEDGEPRFHRLPLTVGEEEALRARLAGKPLPVEEKKSPWKPDTPTYVRFDVGGIEASNRRDQGTGWDDYDPFAP